VKQDEDDRKAMDKKWDKLNKNIKAKHTDYVEPKLPFNTNHLICDYNTLYAKIYDKEKMI